MQGAHIKRVPEKSVDDESFFQTLFHMYLCWCQVLKVTENAQINVLHLLRRYNTIIQCFFFFFS